MFHLQNLIGSVVTIRSIWGNEYVGTLVGFDQNEGVITVDAPQTVAMETDTVMLVPFSVTGQDSEAVNLHVSAIFAVMPTRIDIAKSYTKIVSDK